MLHGSCRKPDGFGNDALPAADTLIAQNVRKLESRPCLLCLTGDQIYANNVHRETLHQCIAGRRTCSDTRRASRPTAA